MQDTKILSVRAAPPNWDHKPSARFSSTGSETTPVVNIMGAGGVGLASESNQSSTSRFRHGPVLNIRYVLE